MKMTWKTASLALVLCAFALAASFHVLQNGDDNIPTASLVRHSAVVDAETIAVQKAGIISAAGQSAVAYINAARGELQADDLAGAKRFLAQAGLILEQIHNALRAERGNRAANGGLRVPLWAEIDLVQEGPASAALTSRLRQASNYAIQGQHGKVARDLEKTGMGLVYSYIDMPLDMTLARLEAAREAMIAGDQMEALRLLVAATDGLLSETVEIGTGEAMPRQTTNQSDRS